jgi:hypothetical protein
MSSRPRADELLDAIGELLEGEVMPAVPAELQHQVRVAANLVQILRREWLLGAQQAALEHAALRDLVGTDMSTGQLLAALDDRLQTDEGTPADIDVRAWHSLVPVVRGELAIVKPGHDQWQGE